ncbi:MAG: hypothetical protein IKI57_04230 [Clostridia bacterium]|nr:hypothetical protein [Clostridia bacterium]
MAGELMLSLNSTKDLNINDQSKNILSNIGEVFSNAIKKGSEKLSFPDGLKEQVKEGFEKINLKEIGEKAAESALKEGMKKLGMKTSTFSSIKSIFEAVKEGDLKKGLSSGFNLAINVAKLPQVAKTVIKEGKDFILEKAMGDELKNLMRRQQNTISRINKKCDQMDEAFKTNDTKTLEKISKSLKTDIEKVMPIQDVINRGNSMLNRYELFKNKNGGTISNTEMELIKKLS